MKRVFDSEKSDFTDFQAICCWESDGLYYFQTCNTERARSPGFGEVFFGGTGSLHISDYLQVFDFEPSMSQDDPDVVSRVLGCAIGMGAQIIGRELLGLATPQLYGGGFEATMLMDKGWEKITDLAFFFWKWERNSSDLRLALMPMFLKQDYLGEDLIIRRFSQDGGSEVHVIRPLGPRGDFDKEQLDKLPDLRAKFVCNIILSDSGDCITRIDINPSREGQVLIEVCQDKLNFSIEESFLKSITSWLAGQLNQ